MWKLNVGIIYPTLIVLITGCSALLDPYNCESDGDCNGGVCMDGICVGDEREVDQMNTVDAMVMSDSTMQPDMTVGEDTGGFSDMSMAADMLPDMAADMAANSSPTCSLVVANELTRESHIDIVIEVTDAEEAASELSVTLNGTALNLNQAGRYEGRFPLDEGPNTAELRALDSAGAECVATALIVRDSTDPTLEITSPQQLQDILTNEPQMRVQGRIDDTHFQPNLILNLDQQPIEPVEPIIWDGQSFEFVIVLQPGFQTLAVSTVDIPGNESEAVEITIELDEQPPVLILEQPNPDVATVASERRFQVRGSLQDNGRPVRNPSIAIRVESNAGLVEYPPVRGNITGEFSQFVELGNGDNTVTVCGQDEAGNESCASGMVTKNAPCVNVDSPVDGTFIGSDRIVVEGSVCEGVVQLTGTIGNGAPVAGALLNGLRFRLDLPSQGDGEREVLLTATNVDGDAATTTVTVNVDSSHPIVTFRTPEANQCVGTQFTVIGTATDLESDVALVTVNGERVENVGLDNMGGEFRHDVSVQAGERDGQEVLVVATNRAGLTAEASTFVQVDTVAPQVTFDILNVNTPINPWLRPDGTGRVNFTGTVEVGQCGIAQGGFSVPGLVPSLDNEGRFTLRGVFEDGQHNLAWRIEDIVGNVRGRELWLSCRLDATER